MSEDTQLSTSSATDWQTDWNKCCLCQEDATENLIPSSKSFKREESGYKNIATNLPLFHKLNALPIPIDIKPLDDGSGIENTLRLNNAKYHNSCRLMFNNSKLQRAQKRGLSREDNEAEAGPSKFTRRSVDIVPDIKVICFFCEKDVIGSDRNAMTKNLYERLSDCAKVLQDEKLIAKLSAGDLVAQEAKYHLNCLNAVYNRERAFF